MPCRTLISCQTLLVPVQRSGGGTARSLSFSCSTDSHLPKVLFSLLSFRPSLPRIYGLLDSPPSSFILAVRCAAETRALLLTLRSIRAALCGNGERRGGGRGTRVIVSHSRHRRERKKRLKCRDAAEVTGGTIRSTV